MTLAGLVGAATPPAAHGRIRSDPEPPALAPATLVLPTVLVTPPPHPLDHVSRAELERRVALAPEGLGTASLGVPNRGALFNPEAFRDSELWVIESAENVWATPESIRALQHAVEAVRREHPGTTPLHIGDASRRRGGYLRPHRSHQSGRDVDVGFYYLDGPAWYAPATASNLDRVRTWALVRALLADGETEYIFLDQGVQTLLVEHALAAGEDPAWLRDVFGGTSRREAPVRHTRGHKTHLHVRFLSPEAVETGIRLGPFLSIWNGRSRRPG